LFIDGIEVTTFKANIEGNLICINVKEVEDNSIVEIRYACLNYVVVNLYSSGGLSAKPFRRILE
jgi:hypothetical protein